MCAYVYKSAGRRAWRRYPRRRKGSSSGEGGSGCRRNEENDQRMAKERASRAGVDSYEQGSSSKGSLPLAHTSTALLLRRSAVTVAEGLAVVAARSNVRPSVGLLLGSFGISCTWAHEPTKTSLTELSWFCSRKAGRRRRCCCYFLRRHLFYPIEMYLYVPAFAYLCKGRRAWIYDRGWRLIGPCLEGIELHYWRTVAI